MENLLKIVEQFLSQSDEKLEELSQKKSSVTTARRRGEKECVNF